MFKMTDTEISVAANRLYVAAFEHQDPRALVLLKAAECVLKNRNNSYGEPEDNFRNIADVHRGMTGCNTAAYDVATFSMAVKEGRLRFDRWHADSHVDLIGYAACRARIAALEQAEDDEDTAQSFFEPDAWRAAHADDLDDDDEDDDEEELGAAHEPEELVEELDTTVEPEAPCGGQTAAQQVYGELYARAVRPPWAEKQRAGLTAERDAREREGVRLLREQLMEDAQKHPLNFGPIVTWGDLPSLSPPSSHIPTGSLYSTPAVPSAAANARAATQVASVVRPCTWPVQCERWGCQGDCKRGG